MGIGRFALKVLIPGYGRVAMVKKMIEKKSVTGGIKASLKEDYCEDNPLTSIIYKMGQIDGKKDGYVEASNEYEKKFFELTEHFRKQKKVYAVEREQYEELLNQYDNAISELQEKLSRSERENEAFKNLLQIKKELDSIQYA